MNYAVRKVLNVRKCSSMTIFIRAGLFMVLEEEWTKGMIGCFKIDSSVTPCYGLSSCV